MGFLVTGLKSRSNNLTRIDQLEANSEISCQSLTRFQQIVSRASKVIQDLVQDQDNYFNLISLSILTLCLLDNVWTLKEEVTCYTLLGVEELKKNLPSQF